MDGRTLVWATFLVLAPACAERSYEVFFAAEARDANGACTTCDPFTLAIYGVLTTDSPEPIVVETPNACLMSHLTLVRDGGTEDRRVCTGIDIDGEWPVSEDAPVEHAWDLSEISLPPGHWEPLAPGDYLVSLEFATAEHPTAQTELTIAE